MEKRVALYLRVSTRSQSIQNQKLDLEAVARRSGWEIVAEYQDAGISGAKGRDKRPGFDRLLKAATRREFELIAAWSVDRLGRSLQDLVNTLNEIHALGIDLYLHQQAIDTSSPAGRMLFQMLGVFAEFERAIIRERVRAGLARAKANGTKLGRRPIGSDIEEKIRKLRSKGMGILRIGREVGVGTSVVQRVVAGEQSRSQQPNPVRNGTPPYCLVGACGNSGRSHVPRSKALAKKTKRRP